MKTLLLLDGVADSGQVAEEFPDATVAFWDRGAALSIPTEVDLRLLDVRSELLKWVYETGLASIKGKTLEEHLRAGDSLSMWWCSTLAEKHPKVTHNLFEALKIRVLEKILIENNIEQVVLISAEHEEAPWIKVKNLEDILEDFCNRTKRTFIHRKRKMTFFEAIKKYLRIFHPQKLYFSLPAILKTMIRFPVWWWTIRRHLPHTTLSRPNVDNPATIVTYFPNIDMKAASHGRFRSRYWENLHDQPEIQEKVNWVFIHFPAPQYSFTETIQLRDRFRKQHQDGASFHFLEEFLTTGDIFRAFLRYIRLTVNSLRIESEVKKLFFFDGSQMNLWSFLKENWADSTRGWRCLERCLMARAFRQYVKWAGQQHWFTFPQENCPWERMLTQAVHEAEAGPVYGAQHSTVRPTDFRYFDDPRLLEEPSIRRAMPDLWLCNGTGAKDALVGSGLPESRIRLVEALRYLYLAKANTTQESTKRLLIVTSFFADETYAHLDTVASAYKAGLLQNWDVFIKPHPYLSVQKKLKQLNLKAPKVVDGALDSFLTRGTVVWASNSTTVALEAAYRHLPVFVQAAENDVNLCPLQNMQGVRLIRNKEDIEAALQNPSAPELPEEYLLLDPTLPRWRNILELN